MAKSIELVLPNLEAIPCDSGVNVNDIVYQDDNGILQKAIGNDLNKAFARGIVYAKQGDTQAVIINYGKIGGFTGLDPTQDYFLSISVLGGLKAGPLSLSLNNVVSLFIGKPLNSEILLVHFGTPVIL